MQRRQERFQNRIALVTGAASGIGQATARQLAVEGAHVCCADVNGPLVEATAAAICQHGGAVSAHLLDVTDEAQWEALMAHVQSVHGRLDVLVNSAGIAVVSPLAEMSFAQWRQVLAVNLDGAFLATKHGVRAMRTNGGSIVHVSSASGIKASPGACAYSASKAGLCMLAKAAAKECRDQNLSIRINAVCPGGVKTPLWRSLAFFQEMVSKTGSEEAAFAAMGGSAPGAAFAEPEDIVQAILFLASDEARFVNGVDLLVDGGYVL